MTPSLAEWTIMVFLNADNNLEPFGLLDFAEMAKIGSTDQVNVIVQFDRNGVWAPDPPWNQCLRFRVTKGMQPLPANALQDLGEANMGDGQVLADFVTWAMQAYPAKRYMLDIWDHGQGWRLYEARLVTGAAEDVAAYREFRRETSLAAGRAQAVALAGADRAGAPTAVPAFDAMSGISAGRVIESSYRYISIDDSSQDKLYNREIQDSLQAALAGHKLDLIGFDACLMAMMETGYAMRNVAQVMVASEELEPGDGWNYADWLKRLVAKPTMDAKALGKLLVAAYRRSYKTKDPTVTLSAVDLNALAPLAELIDALADEMSHKLPAELANIKQARKNCTVYATGYGLHGIDLAHFCEQLVAATADPALRSKARAIHAAVMASVLANYAGPARLGNYGSHGLAIYFPARRALFNTDPDSDGYQKANTFYPVEFVQSHRWADFLQAYYTLVS